MNQRIAVTAVAIIIVLLAIIAVAAVSIATRPPEPTPTLTHAPIQLPTAGLITPPPEILTQAADRAEMLERLTPERTRPNFIVTVTP